jgi:hypothetical protein
MEGTMADLQQKQPQPNYFGRWAEHATRRHYRRLILAYLKKKFLRT